MAKKTRSEKNKLRRLEQRERQKFFRIFGTAFLGLLLAVMLLHFILPDRSYSGAEKRALTQLPALNGRTLSSGEYMSQMDSYLADQFPLRTELMRIRTNLSRFLGQTESQGVFYCSDGSLIEAFDEYDFSLTEKTLEAVGSFLESYKFRNRIFLLIPSAVTLYADKLPAYAQTASEKEYISNVREILPRSLSRPDLLSLLKSVQASGVQVFYETDHHWTTRAAYEVFAALAKEYGWKVGSYRSGIVSNSFLGALAAKSGFSPARRDEIVIYENQNASLQTLVTHTAEARSSGSLYETAALAGSEQYEVFLGGNEPMLVIRTTADTDDTLLVFKDSFANCFIPFLTESYKTITVIDPRYYTDAAASLFLQSDYTDVLFLYSALTLEKDESLRIILEEEN